MGRRLVYCLLLIGCSAAQTAPPALAPGKTVEEQISGGQSREYHFTLEAGQYAKIEVEQRSINVSITLLSPDGKQLLIADHYVIGGFETAELIAEISGDYRFVVAPVDLAAPSGRYDITLREPEAATERHRIRIAATQVFGQGVASWALHTREGLLKGAGYLEEALTQWRHAHDLVQEATMLFDIGLINLELADQAKALDYATRGLAVAEVARDPRTEGWALYCIGQVHNHFGDKRKAIEYSDRALPLMRAARDRAGEGDILNLSGTAYAWTGEKRKALAMFEQAELIFREIQDRLRLATVTGNVGVTYGDLGEYDRALENHELALALHREIKNRVGEAITLNNIGTANSSIGAYQKALDSYQAALEIHRSLGRKRDVAINLHNLAWAYAELGDRQRAFQVYQEALAILREVKDKFGLAHTLTNLAAIYAENGEYQKAVELNSEGLSLRRVVGDLDGEANSLNGLGKAYAKLGERERAREHFERALAIARTSGYRRQLTATLRNLGVLHREAGEYDRAKAYLNEALQTARDIHDRRAEAGTLAELARVERGRGSLAEAHRWADEALGAFEALRLTVSSPKLRASFFASSREVQELDVEALMRMHAERPGEGFDAEALLAVEKGRARSLLELLGESSAEIRRGADPVLVNRERELERTISTKAERQVRMLNAKHTDADAAAAEKELDALAAELDQVQSRIRQNSPQYAALTQPTPLCLREIQTKVLDENTTLLEYALGAEKSFLWVVTRSSLDVFELPKRAEIESAATRAYELLTARNQNSPKETSAARAVRLRRSEEEYPVAALQISRMLLGAAAPLIGNRRLLIVREGVLQYLPFAALPEPGSDAPLVVKHEIVTAPSASVLAVLRQETAGRKPAEKTLAVLGDPVFTASDARIGQRTSARAGTSPVRSANGPNLEDFVRLRFSRSEAEEIARMAGGTTLKALDFDASRATVLDPDFGRHRIVHFATHSLLNNQRPELSGVVLSLVDRRGKPQNGFLRLYDIYNLRLDSDLVVLSACQTALGGEIKGEGLIGLTRAFLYAGAPRVVASQWQIDDRATAELMKRFYERMLVHGDTPAAALRTAQMTMWKIKGWDAPYYWAAFTLQGEWR